MTRVSGPRWRLTSITGAHGPQALVHGRLMKAMQGVWTPSQELQSPKAPSDCNCAALLEEIPADFTAGRDSTVSLVFQKTNPESIRKPPEQDFVKSSLAK